MDIERRMGQRRDSWWISSEGWVRGQRRDSWWISSEGWVRGGIAGGYRAKDGSEEG